MWSLKKIPLFFSIALIILSFSWIISLYFYQNRKTLPYPKPTPLEVNKEPLPEQAVAESNIEYLRTLKKDVVASSILTTEIEAGFVEIDNIPGVVPNLTPSVPYDFRMKFKTKDERHNFIYFSERNSHAIAIVKKLSNGADEPTDITEFKTGDRILIKRTYGLLRRDRIVGIETKITKL